MKAVRAGVPRTSAARWNPATVSAAAVAIAVIVRPPTRKTQTRPLGIADRGTPASAATARPIR